MSATFGPIVRRAQEFEPFDVSLCTEMEVDANGNYTRRVDGECVERRRKVRAITKWANEKYGAGNWGLSCAFGDHHSDIPMLSRAADAFAITPDSTLSRTARETIGMRSIGIQGPRNSASEPLGSRFRRGVRVCPPLAMPRALWAPIMRSRGFGPSIELFERTHLQTRRRCPFPYLWNCFFLK